MPWLEIILSGIIVVFALLTGLSSSPLYSFKQKKEIRKKDSVKNKTKINL